VPLTANDLAWVRTQIGDESPPTDPDLDDIFDRVGSAAGTATEVVRKRLADLLATPASFAVDGYSQNTSANIKALQDLLDYLEDLIPPESGGAGTRIIRLRRDAARR